jgi:hypothetical protein
MSEPVSSTVTSENGTIGPFYLNTGEVADVAIKRDAGTAALQKKLDEATGFITLDYQSGAAEFTESKTLEIRGAGTWQILCTGSPNITATFRKR